MSMDMMRAARQLRAAAANYDNQSDDYDAVQARGEAGEQLLKVWMDDAATIMETWDELEGDGASLSVDIGIAMTGHADDRAIRAERLLAHIESLVESKMRDMIGDELDADGDA